jgi:tripartite-type tricarboxylate transporter receptor subunit TctC
MRSTVQMLAVAAAMAVTGSVSAQAFPSKPIRVIVPAAPGGIQDNSARALGQAMTASLGQPLLVENRAGANGNLGAEACARAAPDGYTVCFLAGVVVALNPLAYANIPFDPEKDFIPVVHVNWFETSIVVNAGLPATNVRELVELARAKPGAIDWGSLGSGSTAHLYMEWLQTRTGTTFNHVPYKGAPQLLLAATTGEVQVMTNTPGTVLPHVKAGKLRVVAVISGKKRSALLPDVPTFQEQGFELDFRNWNAMFYQRGVPAEIVKRLNTAANGVLHDAAFDRKYFAPMAGAASGGSPEDLAEIVRQQRATGAELVRIAKLKLE